MLPLLQTLASEVSRGALELQVVFFEASWKTDLSLGWLAEKSPLPSGVLDLADFFFSLCFFHNHWLSFSFSFSPLHCFSAMKSPVFYFLKLILFLCDAYNCITDSSRSEDTAVPQQVVLLLEAVCSKQTSCDTQLCLLSPVHLNEGHSLLPWLFCTQLEC